MNLYKKKPQIPHAKLTANEFINVVDIRDNLLYTRDGYIFAYARVSPVAMELLSDDEKRIITHNLTTELASELKPFKFLCISRPVDISGILDDHQEHYRQAETQEQKEILRIGMETISGFVMSGDVIERQFYTIIWEKKSEEAKEDILRRIKDLVGKYKSCRINAHVLSDTEIVRLCNLFANPGYAHREETGVEATIPVITK